MARPRTPKSITPIKWEDADFVWDSAPSDTTLDRYTWDDVQLIVKAAGGGGDMDEMPWTDFKEDDKKKLVKIILKVYGDTITESKQKEIKQYKIKAEDIRITASKVLGIEVLTENIKL